MKIVALDGHTLNPGDNPWTPVEALGDFAVYDKTPDDQILARAEGATVILTNKVPLAAETYGRLGEEGLRFLRNAAGRACTRTSTLAVLGEEGPPAVLGAWLERQSVALQKNNAAAFRAAAGAAATWRDLRAPGLEEAPLEVLAEAERLAAQAA